jgi:hypothetical protein
MTILFCTKVTMGISSMILTEFISNETSAGNLTGGFSGIMSTLRSGSGSSTFSGSGVGGVSLHIEL